MFTYLLIDKPMAGGFTLSRNIIIYPQSRHCCTVCHLVVLIYHITTVTVLLYNLSFVVFYIISPYSLYTSMTQLSGAHAFHRFLRQSSEYPTSSTPTFTYCWSNVAGDMRSRSNIQPALAKWCFW